MPAEEFGLARAFARARRRVRPRPPSSTVLHVVTVGPGQGRHLGETLASVKQQGGGETAVRLARWGAGEPHQTLAAARNHEIAASDRPLARLLEAGDTLPTGSTSLLAAALDGTGAASAAGRSVLRAPRSGWRDAAFRPAPGAEPGLGDRLIRTQTWKDERLSFDAEHGRFGDVPRALLHRLPVVEVDDVVHEDRDRGVVLPFGHLRRWAHEVDTWCAAVLGALRASHQDAAGPASAACPRCGPWASTVLDRRVPVLLQDVESFTQPQWQRLSGVVRELWDHADPDLVRAESKIHCWATTTGDRAVVTELVLSRWREPADLPTVVEGTQVTTLLAQGAVPAPVRRLGAAETPLTVTPRRRDADVLEAVAFVRGVETDRAPEVRVVQDGQELPSTLTSTPLATRLAGEAEHAHDHGWLQVDLRCAGSAPLQVTWQHGALTRTCELALPAEMELVVPPDPRGHDEIGPHAQRRLQRWYAEPRALEPDLAYFQAFTGHHATDNPLAVHEALRRLRPDIRTRWLVDDLAVPVPAGSEAVLVRSREYYRTLSTARWVVTNIEMERWFRRRPDQVLVQTWHGNPGKSMGLAAWRRAGLTPGRIEKQLAHGPDNWSLLVSPSPGMTELYREQFAYGGPVEDHGYPRDDVLVGPGAAALREDARRRLGLEPDELVVLYAPTWREEQATNYRKAHLHDGFDPVAAAEALGPGCTLLLRGHRFHRAATRPTGARVRDVTTWPEVNDLLLAADAAVLDYSSLRFDFALTGRPMVFCVPDLETYTGGRGFLYDFAESAPGPLVRTTGEVVEALRDLEGLTSTYAAARAAFHDRFNRFQDGRAAERVARRMLDL